MSAAIRSIQVFCGRSSPIRDTLDLIKFAIHLNAGYMLGVRTESGSAGEQCTLTAVTNDMSRDAS